VVFSVHADSSGRPEAAWALIAEPARWHEWAPHVRGARGLGSPEVEAGRRGVVLLFGALPVPVSVLDTEPGRSWLWQVGPVRFRHAVEPTASGCMVSFTLWAPAPLEAALALSYGPVMSLVARRLARRAASQPEGR
jgi:hypothetical protein